MAISDKLTYLSTTKSQLKDQINYGLPTEKQITSSTTFRNYVPSIFEAFLESLRNPDTLFTNLPKTTGTGTQITLNGTAYAPMRINLNPTAISQDGTPTPSSPQDIHTISGNNSVVVDNGNGVSQTAPIDLGKNLFDKNNAYVSGNNNQDIAIQLNDLKVGTKYKFYANGKVWLKILTYDSNSTLKRTLGNTNQTKVIEFYPQSGETSFYFSFYAQNNVDISTYDFTNVYIFENDYELGTIGNYSNEFVRSNGKNLFDDTLELGSINGSGYNVVSTTDLRNVNYILVEPNTTYTISIPNTTRIAIRYYDANKTFLSNGSTNNSPNTFTTPNNCYYARFIFLDQTNTSLLVMLNLGSTALPYEPYGTNQWYLKKNIGKVVLDGSESGWWFQNNQFRWSLPNPSIYGSMFYSQHFAKDSSENANTPNKGFIYNANYYKINNGIDGITDIAGFKTWLSNNNDVFYYILKEPTYTQITGTLETQLENIYKNMLSYSGQTNISQINNDLPFTLDVSAIEVQ